MRSNRTLLTVTREDFQDAFRERQGYVVVGIFVVFAGVSAYNFGRATRPDGESIVYDLVPQLFPILNMFVPLIAIGFFSAVIVKKRESGSVKVMLGLPIRRRDVVIGTFLSRSLVVTLGVVAALGLAVAIGSVTSVRINLIEVLGAVFLLSLVGILFTSFAIAISVYVRSTVQAILTGFVVWAFFALQYWAYIPLSVLYIRHGFSLPDTIPAWVDGISALNPLSAYAIFTEGLFPQLGGGTFVDPPANLAIVGEPAVAFGIILSWIFLGQVLAVRQFQAMEI